MDTRKITDLNPAKYNPRKISREKLQSLKDALLEFGDLSGIVFNRRSGNLVGGHQRCKVIPPDAEITITATYDPPTRTGTIAEGHIMLDGEKYTYREVDWDEAREKLANLAANNQGGENDEEMLADLLSSLGDFKVDLSLTGIDLNILDVNEDGELEEVMEEIRPYSRTHILLSFPPDKLIDISPWLEKIYEVKGVEHEQSSN
jgi:hypothetical protein